MLDQEGAAPLVTCVPALKCCEAGQIWSHIWGEFEGALTPKAFADNSSKWQIHNKSNYLLIPREQLVESYPGESEAANGVGQHVSEQRRERIQCREVGMHVRTLPMCHLRQSNTQTKQVWWMYYKSGTGDIIARRLHMQVAALFCVEWRHGRHPESVTTQRKSDSANRCVFTLRTFLPHFIPIRFETTEP